MRHASRLRRRGRRLLSSIALLSLTRCGGDAAPALRPEPDEELSGGATTVFDTSRDAFSRPAENITDENETAFSTGNAFFMRNWVTAPASTAGLDGLGPTFNARSCSTCHFKDGRGAPPMGDEPFSALLLRLSVPGEGEHGEPLPEPTYGGQFNHFAINGVEPEGSAAIEYEERTGRFEDGTPYSLEAPRYVFPELNFGPLAPDAMVSPRVAPFVFGLGLLEAIADETLEALADPDDSDGDGVSGRVNRVWDPLTQRTRVGRFGWKANQAGLEQQNSGAFHGDMGLTSPLFPGEDCPPVQSACAAAPTGGSPEIDQRKIDFVTMYTRLLAVPARRDVGAREVLRGKQRFHAVGCASCHVATVQTGELAGVPEVSQQTIHPYTDLLLHDMGEELADGRPDFLADEREWRTPPLWGIGLVERVDGHTRFMHDGRARDLTEAILWHGGEGAAAKQAFEALSAQGRSDLLAFLRSL
ncbi:MAG TPA: di-heme oxidoredictase family protein [Polyangiales bacterium]